MKCPVCKGEGRYFQTWHEGAPSPCGSDCSGIRNCPLCNGSGRVEYVRTEGTRKYYNPVKKDEGCVVTTLVCKKLNLGEDCEIINSFRQFRDTAVTNLPNGREIIDNYYKNAPSLIEKLEKIHMSDPLVFNKIFNTYIYPAYLLIKSDKTEETIELYEKMLSSVHTNEPIG